MAMTPDEAATLQGLMDRGIVRPAGMKYTLTVTITPDSDEYESSEDDALQEWLPELPDTIYVGDDLYNVDVVEQVA